MATPTQIVAPPVEPQASQALATTTKPHDPARGIVLRGLDDYITLGDVLVRSGYFGDMRQAAQAVVKVMAGAELGFGPIASMNGIHIIKGKPALSANLIAAAIKRTAKYNYRIKSHDENECVIEFFEGKESIGTSSFKLEDALKAGLTTGNNAHSWKSYRRNMLFARAISNGARWYCPDVFGGPPYTPEELGVQVSGEESEVIEVEHYPVEAAPPFAAVYPPQEALPVEAATPPQPALPIEAATPPATPKKSKKKIVAKATPEQIEALTAKVKDLRALDLSNEDIGAFIRDSSGTASKADMLESADLTAQAIDACDTWIADLIRERENNPFAGE